jgi:ribonuclease III
LSALPPALITLIGHAPRDPALFIEALTHGSHGGNQGGRDYQRLEFLGDRVLGLVMSEALSRGERRPVVFAAQHAGHG